MRIFVALYDFTVKNHKLFLLAILLIGIALRLVWLTDMEYKGDERKLFAASQEFVAQDSFPLLGIPSSLGVRNPGMSTGIFVLLSYISGAKTPLELCNAVRWLNIFALIYLLFFCYKIVEAKFRVYWLWGFAIACVNPFAVMFQRKIWPQTTLPFFCLLMLTGVFRREKAWGAFLWGFIGLLLCQIHMASFYFVLAAFLWISFADWKYKAAATNWKFFLFGSFLAFLPLIPWVPEFFAPRPSMGTNPVFGWGEVFRFRFWRYWFTEPLGLKMTYSLGAAHFQEWNRFPILFGKNSHLVGITHWLLLASGIVIYSFATKKLWIERKDWKRKFFDIRSNTALIQSASMWLYGIILSVATYRVLIYRHYLIVLFPLTFVFISRLAIDSLPKRISHTLLASFVVLQLFLSVNFLQYIHVNHGTQNADSDYGMTYKRQLELGVLSRPSKRDQ